MERWEYLALVGIAIGVISVSSLFSSEPMSQFLLDGFTEAGSTFVTMVWITWWALVLGFSVAGGVEAWVSSDRISAAFDGAGPKDIALASFFGFISSSCSYSAIATAKNLFKKGGSAAASLGAFMFASTNLVIEIGLVIWILLGWQFVLANYVGGIILIVVMAVILSRFAPASLIAEAREHAQDESTKVEDPVCGMELDPDSVDHTVTHNGETYYFCSQSCKDSFSPKDAVENRSVSENIRSRAGWEKLASKQWSEWMMLWEDILVGFIMAGIIAGFVPDSAWTALFAQELLGMPLALVWATIIGSIIGIATFVCSVGNVPFAAVLWVGGLPFGGVFSYIYADLIVPPIIDAYREYYGTRFGLFLTGTIFVASIIAGILTHYIFAGAGLIPPTATAVLEGNQIQLDYKAVLNAMATVAFLILYYLHRSSTTHDSNN